MDLVAVSAAKFQGFIGFVGVKCRDSVEQQGRRKSFE